MYKIIKKKQLNDLVFSLTVEAPYTARKALAGQFVIMRANERGERIPLTVADYDREKGTITVILQKAGKATGLLSELSEGDYIKDLTGPLGIPSRLDGYEKVCVIGGGVGCAIAYPVAKALFEKGVDFDVIAGFRSKDMIILEDEFKSMCKNFYITTDDGSYGYKGFVTQKLTELIEDGAGYDLIIAIGPVPMMKFVCKISEPLGIKTTVSLNPIMIDGTGMCGCCRVTVDGKIKFACVDGPDFDGHKVDFDELINRNTAYTEQEKHDCNLLI